MLVAAGIIAIMYLGLVFCIAEMSPALPHTGAAYSFARTSMGPWGGFVTGLFENVEYVLTPAVVVTFISSYFSAIVGLDAAWLPIDLGGVLRHLPRAQHLRRGAQLQGDAGRDAGLAGGAGGVLDQRHSQHGFLALGAQHRRRPDGAAVELPEGDGRWFPFGFSGVLATLPFAVWLFLAIEQLPLAAEESVDPKRDMPRGILLGMGTLIISAFMIVLLNPSVIGRRLVRAGHLGRTAARRLPRHLRHQRRRGARPRRHDRADRLVPHHPLRAGPAGLFAEPGGLFPVGAVGDPSELQDAACRHDRRRARSALP